MVLLSDTNQTSAFQSVWLGIACMCGKSSQMADGRPRCTWSTAQAEFRALALGPTRNIFFWTYEDIF